MAKVPKGRLKYVSSGDFFFHWRRQKRIRSYYSLALPKPCEGRPPGNNALSHVSRFTFHAPF
jgi:hypothetical protein